MIIYMTTEMVIHTHAKTVELSGGGTVGRLDEGKLESILTHIQNDDYYPNFCDKLTHLFFSICQFHCFEDGNKRLALSASLQFLLLNGYYHCTKYFMPNMEMICLKVASGKIDKPLLREILESHIDGTFEENESLKLKIIHALTD